MWFAKSGTSKSRINILMYGLLNYLIVRFCEYQILKAGLYLRDFNLSMISTIPGVFKSCFSSSNCASDVRGYSLECMLFCIPFTKSFTSSRVTFWALHILPIRPHKADNLMSCIRTTRSKDSQLPRYKKSISPGGVTNIRLSQPVLTSNRAHTHEHLCYFVLGFPTVF